MAKIQGLLVISEIARINCSRRIIGAGYDGAEGRRVKAYASSAPPFGAATPSGTLDLVIADPGAVALIDQLPLNAEVSITLDLPIPEPAQAEPAQAESAPAQEEAPAPEATPEPEL